MIKSNLILAAVVMSSAGVFGAMGTGSLTSSTRELSGGMIYTVNDDVTINGDAGASALTVKSAGSGEGSIVVIDIQNGHVLTVNGGNANGQTGAGAGILLPEGMTLFVTGNGTLNATGGNAAGGGNGWSGQDAYQEQKENKRFWNGRGGDGGYGGGGAGAGIGGNGGNGANGGGGHNLEIRTVDTKGYPANGGNGSSASGGSNGATGGNVFILGDISATVKGGGSASAGSASSSWGKHVLDTFSNDDWFAGGGGPGVGLRARGLRPAGGEERQAEDQGQEQGKRTFHSFIHPFIRFNGWTYYMPFYLPCQ